MREPLYFRYFTECLQPAWYYASTIPILLVCSIHLDCSAATLDCSAAVSATRHVLFSLLSKIGARCSHKTKLAIELSILLLRFILPFYLPQAEPSTPDIPYNIIKEDSLDDTMHVRTKRKSANDNFFTQPLSLWRVSLVTYPDYSRW